jgi:hypothetical protein
MQDNRVLQRIGARELTRDEVETITGGVRTLTICTFPTPTGFLGDENGPESC